MRLRAGLAVAAAMSLFVGTPPAGAAADEFFADQWALRTVGAEPAWAKGTGVGATIAVVDTGIDLDHEDLAANIALSVDCIGADGDPRKCKPGGGDDHGHGTHVAGIAAAVTGNGIGVAGVAPHARLMSVRALQRDDSTQGGASGYINDIRAAIHWAADQGADVINLSIGENVLLRGLFGSGLRGAIDYAWERGSIPVIASGNDTGLFGSGYGSMPAIVVTATTQNDTRASYATGVGSARWGMAAPGGDGARETQILSTWCASCHKDKHKYVYAMGTSMATPHVAGAAAVLRSLGLSPQQTVNRLIETAVDLGSPGRDSSYGHGRLDLAAATAGFPDRGGVDLSPPPTAPPAPPPSVAPAAVDQPVDPSPEPAPPPPPRRTRSAPATDTTATTQPTPPTTAVPGSAAGTPTTEGGDTVAIYDDPPSGGNSVATWGVIAGTVLTLAVLAFRRVAVRRLSTLP